MRVQASQRSRFLSYSGHLLGFRLGTAPHTVTVYTRATTKGLTYLYYKDYSTVAEWGQYPRLTVKGFRVSGLGYHKSLSPLINEAVLPDTIFKAQRILKNVPRLRDIGLSGFGFLKH